MEARRVFLLDNLNHQSIEINVYLIYQGRRELRHTHIFTYDDCQITAENLMWDDPDNKCGLTKSIDFINNEINKTL